MSPNQDSLTHWMNQAGSRELLEQSEIDELARFIQSADQGCPKRKKYINKIVEHNLRLVIRFVHGFMSSKTALDWGCVDTLDYLQVGALGLHRAAEKYDPTRGYRFSTYATHWIRSFVGRYNLNTISSFTIPEHALRNAYYFESHGAAKMRKSGVVPSEKDTIEAIKVLRSAQNSLSLDSVVNDNKSVTLLDTVQSEYAEPDSFNEGCFDKEMEEKLSRSGLEERQILILRGLFVDSSKAVDIQKNLSLSQGQYSRLKRQALIVLRKTLEPV